MYEIFAKLLEQKGITPYRVYKETGVAQSSLSDWKNGKGTPSAAKLKLIADFLGVTVDYLMTGEESAQKEKPLVNGDDELTEYLDILRKQPGLKMMFQLTKDATKEDVEKAVKVLEAMFGKDEDI